MRYAKGSAGRLEDSPFQQGEVKRVLTRLESVVPHLRFEPWKVSKVSASDSRHTEARWWDRERRKVDVSIVLGSIRVMATCERDEGAVPLEDRRVLNRLAVESERALRAGTMGMVSLIDFGASTVSDEIETRADLRFNFHPVLQFIRSLSHETYENRRLSYGLIVSRTGGGAAPFHEALDNKRFKRITDGSSTALVLDREGKVLELAPLHIPAHEGLAARQRPSWSAALAEAAKEREGVGVGLSREGDLVVVDHGRLVFSQRAGAWRAWNHNAILTRLKSLWGFPGRPGQLSTVLSYLYQVAMDLSFRRSGSLLVVLGSRSHLPLVLASQADRVESDLRTGPERALDRSLLQRSIHKTDRRIVSDLASLDGALIVDRSGKILAYGAMVNPASSAKQGARTRAALGASHKGIAIKVSSDGDIELYRGGKLHFEI